LLPIRIKCVKYESESFNPYSCYLSNTDWLFFIFNTSSKIIITDFEDIFNPEYLNLNKNDEDSWKVYAEKVREVISKCL